jgi:magnesium chelatase family protein
MGYAQVHSCAVWGMTAPRVTVEVHMANGLPSFTLVGLADTEVREARERVRSAIQNSGLDFPTNQRIVVNLAPADLPKDSGRFDLPIAMGILAASGQLDQAAMQHHVFAGELSLSGALRPVRGALAMALCMAADEADWTWVLPAGSAEEAALLPQARVYRALHLQDVVQVFTPQATGSAPPAPAPGWRQLQPPAWPSDAVDPSAPDLREVRGQTNAKRALEIAAAGGHSLLMVGPPGSGKSMLAQRLIGLLPPLSQSQALASAAMLSLAGQFQPLQWGQRAFRQPHHSATTTALVGGGVPPRPGAISLAHHGVLFLDELLEFSRQSLEALREPLETGRILLSRGRHHTELPAQFQLIAAMNPCPCGYLGATQPACKCAPEQVARYQARLSGPLADRLDMQVQVPALPPEVMLQAPAGEASADVRDRCQVAQQRALARQGVRNQDLSPAQLQDLPISAQAQAHLLQTASRHGWSGRAISRVMKVAQTIADLGQADQIEHPHVAQAMHYRSPERAS